MSLAHSSHIGLGGYLRRLCECMFWPGMSAQMKDFVGQCDICLTHRDSQVREPLLQHEVPPRPWARVAADICFHSGRVLLVIVDYFSNFIEVGSLSPKTSKSVIRSLLAIFSHFGVPDTLVTGNGPCFALSEFAKFADQWNFEHVTSSPRYLQSNGKAENAVRTVEGLFTKCRAAVVSEFQALLDWRNTPSEGMDSSPTQRLLGRRCKTLLPTPGTLLTPGFSLANDAYQLRAQKERQCWYYNRGKRPLLPVKPGETVRVRSPAGTWKQAECLREVAPRSYDVLIDGAVCRLNRNDIWHTGEPLNAQAFEEPVAEFEQVALTPPATALPVPFAEPVTPSPVAESSTPRVITESTAPSSEAEDVVLPSRRSTSQRGPPERFKNFVMS